MVTGSQLNQIKSRWSKWLMIWLWCPHVNLTTTADRGVLEEAGCFSNKDLVSHFCLFYKSECWCSSNYFREWMTLLKDERHEQDLESSKLFEIKCFFISTRIYGHLRWPFFSPFGYGRVPELFRMTNIWNGNNLEGMTLIRKEWQ